MKTMFALVISFAFSTILSAQKLTIEDYKKAVSFAHANYYNKTALNIRTNVVWFEDGEGLYFKDYSRDDVKHKYIDLESSSVSNLFDHGQFAQHLSEISDSVIDPLKIEIDNVQKNKSELTFLFGGKTYVYNLESNEVNYKEVEPAGGSPYESASPDGEWIAFAKDYNLYIKSKDGKDTFQLTSDGEKNYEHASYYGWFDKMQGENGDRPQRFSVSWSPDSKYLRANLVDLRNASKMYMLDYSEDDKFRPTLYGYYRGSPGDTNMVLITPKFFDVENKSEIDLALPARTHINSARLSWMEETGKVLYFDVERGFQQNKISMINLVKGEISPLFEEKSTTNIDNFRYYPIEQKDAILVLSQRSGWRHLYKYSLKDGQMEALTNGEFRVNDLIYLDEESGTAYISVSGKEAEMNPYHQQIYRVTLDGDVKLLTHEALHHHVSFSPDGQYFVDNMSTVTIPNRCVLRSSKDGAILADLTVANVDYHTARGWTSPMVFTLTAKDEKTPIYGAIWKPTNFDSTRSYPLIDHSYTGPHTNVFPKSFDDIMTNQALAELGFVVMMVDGLGTTGRSKAFQDHSYKNMGANLEDHVLAIKHLANKYSWIDGERVGIYGHSAGGYDAGHGMLAFPDTYKVGVASSADHDFRMEKAWWPEMYMGWPVDSTYHEVSNITMASNLKGKLLLVHGNMDDNVNVSATYKLAEALIKADKEFDLLIFPSQRHGYRGQHREYFIKKRWNYFVEHLLGQEPIWEFSF